MTKKEMIDLVIDYLSGGSTPQELKGKFHPKVIEKYIDLGFSSYIRNFFFENKKFTDFSEFDQYTKTYPQVQVYYDKFRDRLYSELPSPLIQLPDNVSIRLIAPPEAEHLAFSYIKNTSLFIHNYLDSFYIDNTPSYFVEGQKVFYDKLSKDVKFVLMKLIVPLSSYDEDEEVNMPMGQEGTVLEHIIKFLLGKWNIPEKGTNNNNSNIK